jgi:hypothetical protein
MTKKISYSTVNIRLALEVLLSFSKRKRTPGELLSARAVPEPILPFLEDLDRTSPSDGPVTARDPLGREIYGAAFRNRVRLPRPKDNRRKPSRSQQIS